MRDPIRDDFECCGVAGNLNGVSIHLYHNNLKEFTEAVYKPIFSETTATILIDQSKTHSIDSNSYPMNKL